MSVTGHWACHRAVTKMSPFFINWMWNLQKTTFDMSHICQWDVTKVSQDCIKLPQMGILHHDGLNFAKMYETGTFCDILVTNHWHLYDMSEVAFWRFCIQQKNGYFFVTSLWQPCDTPVTCSKVTCHRHVTKIDFLSNWSTIARKHLWICHTYVTEMWQKSPWLSFGGETWLKISEFLSSFPTRGTLLSL